MSRVAMPMLGLVALVVVACGGPITDDELQRGVDSLGATAAEGRLVALDVVEGRTKTTFVRVESRDLGEDAQHEAEKLHDARAEPGTAQVKAQVVKLAQDIAAELGAMQVAPDDRLIARRVEARLDALSKRAEGLTSRL